MTLKTSPLKTISNQNGVMRVDVGGARYPNYDQWKQSWNGNRFPPPPSGSVLYLPGYPGQGSTIQDFSGQGNHGTITGATWVGLPSGLWAPSFDENDDYLDCGEFANSQAEFWVVCWFILDSSPGAQQPYIFHKDDTERVFVYFPGTTTLTFRTLGYGANFNTGCGAPAVGVWHLLIAKLSSTAGAELWIDNVSKMTDAGNKSSPDGGNIYFGNSSNIGTNGFGGRIALQRIITSALSTGHRTNIYQQERNLFGV